MLPSGLMTSSDSGIKLSIDQRFNTLLIRTLKQAFVRIITVAVLLVITGAIVRRSEEHTSELQSRENHVALHSFPTRRSSDLNNRRSQMLWLQIQMVDAPIWIDD